MSAGWVCTVITDHGEILLEQLDASGQEWLATGPAGDAEGDLASVLADALGPPVDSGWLSVTTATIESDCATGRRSLLLAK